ncbi:MAG: hypothetical protein ACRDXX_13780 [Stackebrandtia sp.]
MSLSADLEKLWKAGAVRLPHAAAKFGEAAQAVHRSHQSVDEAFGGSSIKSEWTQLCQTLQNRILATTRNRLVTAGEALVKVAHDYAETDADAAAHLYGTKDEDGVVEKAENNDDYRERPPGNIPEAPEYDDPHGGFEPGRRTD